MKKVECPHCGYKFPPLKKRNEAIKKELSKESVPVKTIAKKFGLTPAAIWQIAKKNGYKGTDGGVIFKKKLPVWWKYR